MMFVSCLVLVWLFGGQPLKKVEPIPTDGLIEAVASVKDAMQDPPQPSPSDKHEKAKREIIIFTRPNCPPCDRWKRIEQPKFERAGWTVAYCSDHNFALTPHFLIEENGKKYENKGYLPFDKIDEVIK